MLRKEGIIPRDIYHKLQITRIKRNKAVHKNYEDIEEAKLNLYITYNILQWFTENYADWELIEIDSIDNFIAMFKSSEEDIYKGGYKYNMPCGMGVINYPKS